METIDLLRKALSSLERSTPEEVKAKVEEKGINIPRESLVPTDNNFVLDLYGLFGEAVNTHKINNS